MRRAAAGAAGDAGFGRGGRTARRRDLGRIFRPARGDRARRGPLARRRRRAGGAFPRRRAGQAGRSAGHHRSGALCGRGRPRAGAGRRRAGARRAHQERARARPSSCLVRATSRSASSTSGSTPTARRRPICAARKPRCNRRSSISTTQVRAPVAGRVGRLEITVGNLVAAGPGAPVLTNLVSVDPIYASFNADEEVVARALKALAEQAHGQVERIPVEMQHRDQQRHAVSRPAATDRQPGRCAQRHRAGARGVRQSRRQADAGAVRPRCAWASRRPSPPWW